MDKQIKIYLDKIIKLIKNDYPLFKNLKDYGFYDQLSNEEMNYVLSNIFQQTVKKYINNIINENGNRIYFEHSDGYWVKYEYDKNGNEIYYEDSDGYWIKREYDERGKEIYKEFSDGKWEKREYDENGNKIYFENYNGYWIKYEYDENGNEIYKEFSNVEKTPYNRLYFILRPQPLVNKNNVLNTP
jgi:hypothetical protein